MKTLLSMGKDVCMNVYMDAKVCVNMVSRDRNQEHWAVLPFKCGTQ